ncbi:2-amino-4-hydroxy-6-hydroxymethyldihydropteridine diphosphokinase [Mucilaginibacter sp. UYP25]|uniref:2-amino-4-hydroxy-6- hydroxymethyldihydropteridine diphosphokinase n=1 Tax=unclassified Mucilaginibacter TaxID=2617802 RepID=UPI003391D65C
MINVFLLLGSNLGNRKSFLHMAIEHVGQEVGTIIQKSPVYETQSWGKTDLPDYLNQVILLQTTLTAQQVLEKVLGIEIELGRTREERWGSRTIDIDILFYGDEIINDENLTVPHPQLHNRKFTLEPLGMIAPDFIHPVLNKTILDLKNSLNDDLVVKKL